MHTSAPYVRKEVTCEHEDFEREDTGQGYGFPRFLTILSELYAAEYKGPFTIGVQCTAAASASQSLP